MSSEGAQTLLWLRGGAKPHPHALAFAAEALATFGLPNGQHIQDRCEGKVKQCVNAMRLVLPQIQNGLWNSERTYADLSSEDLRQWIASHCPRGIDRQKYFECLKQYSYRALSFPQLGLMDPAPEFSHLERVEAVRKTAFPLLVQWLGPQQEEKGEPASLDDEWMVTDLYFKGALTYGDAEVRFAELIELWGSCSENNPAFQAFLAKLTTRHWAAPTLLSLCAQESADGNTSTWLLDLLKREQASDAGKLQAFLAQWSGGRCVNSDLAWMKEFLAFREIPLIVDFIAQCSVVAVEHNLQIPFSPSLKQYFLDLFRRDESIRSDICYFTSRMPVIYDMDFARFNRPSVPLLVSLQIFFFMVQTYGVKKDNRDALLDMLIHREEKRGERLAGFPQRSWTERVPPRETEILTQAFSTMEAILQSIARKPVAFSSEAAEGRELFQDPYCWPLFAVIWQSGKMGPYAQLFLKWSVDPGTPLTLKEAYELALQVKDRLTEDNVRVIIDLMVAPRYEMLPAPQ